MKVTGSYTFDADVQTVWDSMLSPDVLSGCIPGCDRFVPSGDDSYDVEMTVRIASIRGSYKGAVKIEDKVHLQSYRMVVTGSGRGGSVQGSGDLSFSERQRQDDRRHRRRFPGHGRRRPRRPATYRRSHQNDDEPVLRLPPLQNRGLIS